MRAKACKKPYVARCIICDERDTLLLENHRVHEGKDGGKYHWANIACLCPTCHAKVHTGRIRFLGRHLSSSGSYVWRCMIDGSEVYVRDT